MTYAMTITIQKQIITLSSILLQKRSLETNVLTRWNYPMRRHGWLCYRKMEEVRECFHTIISRRQKVKVEPIVDGKHGFLYLDINNTPILDMRMQAKWNKEVDKNKEFKNEQNPCKWYAPLIVDRWNNKNLL